MILWMGMHLPIIILVRGGGGGGGARVLFRILMMLLFIVGLDTNDAVVVIVLEGRRLKGDSKILGMGLGMGNPAVIGSSVIPNT